MKLPAVEHDVPRQLPIQTMCQCVLHPSSGQPTLHRAIFWLRWMVKATRMQLLEVGTSEKVIFEIYYVLQI
jgi:hypothetical protein